MDRQPDIAEKANAHHDEPILKGTAHEAAERGHTATDMYESHHDEIRQANLVNRYGNTLVTFDPKEEARVRLKIDLYIIPTVFLLYLFCFIDRANIGNARLAGLEEGKSAISQGSDEKAVNIRYRSGDG